MAFSIQSLRKHDRGNSGSTVALEICMWYLKRRNRQHRRGDAVLPFAFSGHTCLSLPLSAEAAYESDRLFKRVFLWVGNCLWPLFVRQHLYIYLSLSASALCAAPHTSLSLSCRLPAAGHLASSPSSVFFTRRFRMTAFLLIPTTSSGRPLQKVACVSCAHCRQVLLSPLLHVAIACPVVPWYRLYAETERDCRDFPVGILEWTQQIATRHTCYPHMCTYTRVYVGPAVSMRLRCKTTAWTRKLQFSYEV